MKTEVDALYSNPDEIITDDAYRCLQHSQKMEVSPQKMVRIGYDYPKLNDTHSQTDPVVQKHDTEPSPAQQKSTDVEVLYAVPDKKKKTSNKVPAVPEKSSELIDPKEAGVR